MEILNNHDLRGFHLTRGPKKYLLVPIILQNIQERTVAAKERGVASFKKRGAYMGNNSVPPEIISGVTFSAFSLQKCLRKLPRGRRRLF